jgi:hypothetical protein
MKHLKSLAILILVATSALLTGCSENPTYYKLTEADMSWLHYENNQSLIFTNPNGDFIQYDVVLRVKAYTVEGNLQVPTLPS